jgi:cobalt-zinc-cadmium efflux system outer membrane protein
VQEAVNAMAHAHPLLAVARANTRTAEFNIRAAGLWTNPQFNVTYTRTIPPTPTAYDTRLGYITIGATQLLELARLPTARRDAAEYERRGVVSDGLGVYRGLVFDVYTAFVAVVEATNRLAILRQVAEQLGEAQRVVNARVSAGAAPHYDFSRMTVALADIRAQVADAEADAIAARGNLDVAVGPDATNLHGVPLYDLIASMPIPSLDSLAHALVTDRPDIVAARARVLEAGAQISIARRSVFQGVQLYGGIGIGAGNSPDPTCMTSNSMPVCPGTGIPEIDGMLGLTMPLPFVDRGQGTIPAAEAHAEAMLETAHALEVSAQQRLSSAYNEVMRRRQALQAYIDTGAAQSFAMSREAQAQYRAGRIQILDLVDAFTAVRDAQLRLLSLALDARNAEINLFRAAGNVH